VLSGDGGDEVFAGYNRYRQLVTLFGFRKSPLVRKLMATAVSMGRRGADLLGLLDRIALPGMPQAHLDTVLLRAGRFLQPALAGDAYRAAMTLMDKEDLRRLGVAATGSTSGRTWGTSADNLLREMLKEDYLNYLPGDTLAKVDRASMRASLEVRLPLLDREVVEFSWTQSNGALIRGRESKYLLRELLARHVPRQLFERPKMGFTVPLDSWLRGPLNSWARDLLMDSGLAESAGLVPHDVASLWQRFMSGCGTDARNVWGVAILLAWVQGVT